MSTSDGEPVPAQPYTPPPQQPIVPVFPPPEGYSIGTPSPGSSPPGPYLDDTDWGAPGSPPPGPYLGDSTWAQQPPGYGSPPPGPYLSDTTWMLQPPVPGPYGAGNPPNDPVMGAPPPGPAVSDAGPTGTPSGPRTEYHEPLLTRIWRRVRGGE